MNLNKPDIGWFANFLAKIMKLFVNRSKSTFLYAINLSLGYFLFKKNFSHKKIQKSQMLQLSFFCKIANKAAILRRTLPWVSEWILFNPGLPYNNTLNEVTDWSPWWLGLRKIWLKSWSIAIRSRVLRRVWRWVIVSA